MILTIFGFNNIFQSETETNIKINKICKIKKMNFEINKIIIKYIRKKIASKMNISTNELIFINII